jgi:hypothetical protein
MPLELSPLEDETIPLAPPEEVMPLELAPLELVPGPDSPTSVDEEPLQAAASRTDEITSEAKRAGCIAILCREMRTLPVVFAF